MNNKNIFVKFMEENGLPDELWLFTTQKNVDSLLDYIHVLWTEESITSDTRDLLETKLRRLDKFVSEASDIIRWVQECSETPMRELVSWIDDETQNK